MKGRPGLVGGNVRMWLCDQQPGRMWTVMSFSSTAWACDVVQLWVSAVRQRLRPSGQARPVRCPAACRRGCSARGRRGSWSTRRRRASRGCERIRSVDGEKGGGLGEFAVGEPMRVRGGGQGPLPPGGAGTCQVHANVRQKFARGPLRVGEGTGLHGLTCG